VRGPLKGVGESGTLPVAAVIASAVEDALGEGGRVEQVSLTHPVPQNGHVPGNGTR